MADIKIKRRILSACQTNCYYVFRDGSDEMVIIDPGDRGDIVYQDVKSLGCNKIAGILLTHGHGDHTGGALQLKELTGAKIYAYEEEAELLTDLVASGALIHNYMRDLANIEEIFRR